MGLKPLCEGEQFSVPDHLEPISVDAVTEFSSKFPETTPDIHRDSFILNIPLQSIKCGKRNICVVNCIHLIYLDS